LYHRYRAVLINAENKFASMKAKAVNANFNAINGNTAGFVAAVAA
jgi:hypothetical protein